jgi:protein-disulfide isomerase
MLRRTFLAGFVLHSIGLPAISAFAQSADVAELVQPGPLPEKVFGDSNAPVTVIEYASLTCHHCQNFHKNTWPSLKAKYVDTGKVRFIMREFPLDPLAMAGFMLARCAGEDKWYPVVDLLYQTGEGWAHSGNPVDALAQTNATNRDVSRAVRCLPPRRKDLQRDQASFGSRQTNL